jgi:hypothetical protein
MKNSRFGKSGKMSNYDGDFSEMDRADVDVHDDDVAVDRETWSRVGPNYSLISRCM